MGSRRRYKEGKREYEDLCKRKKEEENVKWEKEAEQARTEIEVWKIVNRGRKRREKVEDSIQLKQWKIFFMEGLSGVEWKVVMWGE